MDWIVSAGSIIIVILSMRKYKHSPVFGAIWQLAWIYYAISIEQYGLLPCSAAFLITYLLSIKKWRREG